VKGGTVDIYANHGLVIVGPEDLLPVLDWGDQPAACDGRHLVVRTRGQVDHTRVSVWTRAMPVISEPVFQGILAVQDNRIWIGDLERINWYVKLVEHTGPQPVTVCVDDRFDASRVYLGFGLGDAPARVALTAVEGHPLPDLLVAPGHHLVQANELGLILDDYDSALARLAAAIKLTSRPRPDPTYPWFDIDTIAQWLRRLAWDLSLERARAMCTVVGDRIAASQPTEGVFGLADQDAITLASQILGRI